MSSPAILPPNFNDISPLPGYAPKRKRQSKEQNSEEEASQKKQKIKHEPPAITNSQKVDSMGNPEYLEVPLGTSKTTFKVTHKHTGKQYIAKRLQGSDMHLLEKLAGCEQIITYELVPSFLLYPVYDVLNDYRHDERFAWKFAVDLMKALKHCHSLGIIHKDIKCDNVVFDEKTKTFKLIDFGIAILNTAGFIEIGDGTPGYQAPELFEKGIKTNMVDIWAAGVAISDLLLGYEQAPYYKYTGSTNWEVKKQEALTIREDILKQFKKEKHANDKFKQGMLPIIKGMLEPNVASRLTAELVLSELEKLKPQNQDIWEPITIGK